MQLFRCTAYIAGHTAEPEVLVFFEAPSARTAADRMKAALSQAWCVSPDLVEGYNMLTEHEVLHIWAMADATTGDARLLESGFSGDTVLYHRPERTLFLVRGTTLARLVKAQARASELVAWHQHRVSRQFGAAL